MSSTAQLVGFAGDQLNYDESAPHFRWTGHVGLRYHQEPQTIYGFTPDTPLLHDTHALVNTLLDGERFAGRVADDAAEFEDATQSAFGQILVFWDIPNDRCLHADCGFSQVLQDLRSTGLEPSKLYAFPPEAPRTYRQKESSTCDHLWGQSCFNCATYPASVGLPIPDDSGMLPQYLVKLLQEGARCRCYQSGRWLHSLKCEATWNKALMDSCKFEEPSPEL